MKHGRTKAHKYKDGEPEEATDDIFFDEYVMLTRRPSWPPVLRVIHRAFHIVKAFIDLGTHNTVESLQAL